MSAAAASSSSAAAALLAPGIDRVDHADYRPGAIKKLELTNFMTHTYVELRPSSAVNFVLGANGSGKSSLVCALCLGLGGDVRDMERGKELKAYIMTGKTEATIMGRGERPARARGAAGRPAPRRCALFCRHACPAAPASTAAALLARARRAQTLLTGRPGDGGDWEVVRTLKTSGGNSWRINSTEVAHDGVSMEHATSLLSLSLSLPPRNCSRAHLHSPLLARFACVPASPVRAQTRCAFCARRCPSRWTTSACSCRRSA